MRADKRKKIRKPLHYPARVSVGEDSAPVACLLSDVSDTGARLTLRAPRDLPEVFQLWLSRDGAQKRRCRIVWRTDEQVGIEFEKIIAAPVERFGSARR